MKLETATMISMFYFFVFINVVFMKIVIHYKLNTTISNIESIKCLDNIREQVRYKIKTLKQHVYEIIIHVHEGRALQ